MVHVFFAQLKLVIALVIPVSKEYFDIFTQNRVLTLYSAHLGPNIKKIVSINLKPSSSAMLKPEIQCNCSD